MPTFEDLFESKVTKKVIEQVEARMKLKLPEEYKAFLLKQNGGQPTPSKFMIPDCQGEALVDWLYGIGGQGNAGDIEHENSKKKGELPAGFLLIGRDPGGNRILLATKGKTSGKVFYWDSARHFDCSTAKQNTYPIADDFESFLKSLTPV